MQQQGIVDSVLCDMPLLTDGAGHPIQAFASCCLTQRNLPNLFLFRVWDLSSVRSCWSTTYLDLHNLHFGVTVAGGLAKKAWKFEAWALQSRRPLHVGPVQTLR